MKKLIESAKASIAKLETVWIVFFSLNSLLGSVLTIASQVDLDTLSGYRLLLACVSILFTWSTVMMAFIKQTGKAISKGKTIFDDDGETAFIKRGESTLTESQLNIKAVQTPITPIINENKNP